MNQRSVRPNLNKLLQVVNKYIVESDRISKDARSAANELSRIAAGSWSSTGDKEHAKNQAQMNEERYKKLIQLRDEIYSSLQKVPQRVDSICFITLELSNGKFKNLYVTKNPLYVDGFNLISVESPVGKAVVGKKLGDPFEYVVGMNKNNGKIIKIS